MTRRKKKKLRKPDEIVLIPFTDEYFDELIAWLQNDDDTILLNDFMYGCKSKVISEASIRSMFYKYNLTSHVYLPLRICIKTNYNTIIPIGNTQITMAKDDEK